MITDMCHTVTHSKGQADCHGSVSKCGDGHSSL